MNSVANIFHGDATAEDDSILKVWWMAWLLRVGPDQLELVLAAPPPVLQPNCVRARSLKGLLEVEPQVPASQALWHHSNAAADRHLHGWILPSQLQRPPAPQG